MMFLLTFSADMSLVTRLLLQLLEEIQEKNSRTGFVACKVVSSSHKPCYCDECEDLCGTIYVCTIDSQIDQALILKS